MKDRFEKSCFDYYVIRSTTQCNRLNCEVIHNPTFDILFNEANNEYCYCLDRQQLDQYWQCIAQNHNLLCPRKCDRCNACKEVSLNIFNLQKSYFFIQILNWMKLRNHFNQLNGVFLQLQIRQNLEQK